jgi:epoxyqueuosine reductase
MKRKSFADTARPRFTVTMVEEPTYEVDAGVLDRYNPRDDPRREASMKGDVGERRELEDSVQKGRAFVGSLSSKTRLSNLDDDRKGYTGIDYSLSEAVWTVKRHVDAFAYNPERLREMDDYTEDGDKWYRDNFRVEDAEEMTAQLKKAARFYGAALVGVTEVNPLWVLTHEKKTMKPLELPDWVKYAVVMAVEMDDRGIATAPACPGTAATGKGYLDMAVLSALVAEFIRNLSYNALPAGNDLALNIPLAVDAGLGQVGRNGLLITPEFGPRIRLCKVFTDLPLEPDRPVNFGVTEFCKTCKRCAKACEVDAISMETEPTWEPACDANNPGALKWYVDTMKCHNFWYDNGTECATCIAVCPYNTGSKYLTPREFWEQD